MFKEKYILLDGFTQLIFVLAYQTAACFSHSHSTTSSHWPNLNLQNDITNDKYMLLIWFEVLP